MCVHHVHCGQGGGGQFGGLGLAPRGASLTEHCPSMVCSTEWGCLSPQLGMLPGEAVTKHQCHLWGKLRNGKISSSLLYTMPHVLSKEKHIKTFAKSKKHPAREGQLSGPWKWNSLTPASQNWAVPPGGGQLLAHGISSVQHLTPGGVGQLYLGEHDVLPPPAQRDAQEVVDGRRVLQAHCPVPRLLWCPAQHHIPSSLWGECGLGESEDRE